MNIIKLFYIIGLIITCANASHAQIMKGQATQSDIDYANRQLPLLADLGEFKTAAVINSDNNSLLIEYLPVGDNLDNWQTMATLTVIPCTNDQKICGNLSQKLANDILNTNPLPQFNKQLIDQKIWKKEEVNFSDTTPQTTFFHYKIGDGNIQENIVGFIYITTNTNNIFQLQKRGQDKLTDNEIAKMRKSAEVFANIMIGTQKE